HQQAGGRALSRHVSDQEHHAVLVQPEKIVEVATQHPRRLGPGVDGKPLFVRKGDARRRQRASLHSSRGLDLAGKPGGGFLSPIVLSSLLAAGQYVLSLEGYGRGILAR